MDKTRILPPLVRGKVTGVLDFFVDEIRLFRNILPLTDNFDLVLQIQWWGEVLPAYIRPKKIQVQNRNCENTHSIESYYHSAKYEIKTTLDLFKLYLKTCEVVELSILEAVENYVIGSAFLRDLINVLNQNNELITLPIFDSLGEQIGEVIIHINFLEGFEPKNEEGSYEMDVLLKKKSVDKKTSRDNFTPTIMHSDFLREKTISYDGCSKNLELGLPFDQYNFKIKKKEIAKPSQEFNKGDCLFKRQEINVENSCSREDVEVPCKCFPEIKSSNDSSKILYFGLNSQPSKLRSNINNPNLKLANKFNSNSVKFKSKSKSAEILGKISSEPNLCTGKIVKKPESSRNVSKKSVTDVEKQFDRTTFQKNSATQPTVECKQYKNFLTSRSDTLPCKQTDPYKIPSKESSNVLDYLLGSDMSKDDEKIALNDFKQMSPSHNLVNSISQLCLASNRDVQETEERFDLSFPKPVKQNQLNFDFENPIERTYYEKFFLKSNLPPDLEIAELLNQPENRFMLGTSNSQRTPDFKSGSDSSSLKSNSKRSNAEREELDEEECLEGDEKGLGKKNNCARCKYYKKLDELDVIIESLKHFEQKMISDEKQVQSTLKETSDAVIKKNLTKYS